MKYFLLSLLALFSLHTSNANTEPEKQEYLVKLTPAAEARGGQLLAALNVSDTGPEALPLDGWYKVEARTLDDATLDSLKHHPDVLHIQKNYKLGLFQQMRFGDPRLRKAMLHMLDAAPPIPGFPNKTVPENNPTIPGENTGGGSGADPMFSNQWGMNDIGVKEAWKNSNTKGAEDMIVAVIDTGVDYTHEDLVQNLWRNKKEIPNNNKDDDNNGYFDDVIGWDFVENDNKPYDLTTDMMQMLLGGGNPGHGTHCAGNVAARADNGKGVAGVAPNVKIMSLRFISEKGEGTTADAIKAIKYAVDNGAKVLSNSWGSLGEDPKEEKENKALREAIIYSRDQNTLFVAAAGNGDQSGKGFDNDKSKTPAYPATYPYENIVSVAAIDSDDKLGAFSNWGAKSVALGAPGVKVFSTMVANNYSDVVIDLPGIMTATWDGTSMATPHVAGAAALYLSKHPTATYTEVKQALIKSAAPISALKGKTISNGKLDVKALMEL